MAVTADGFAEGLQAMAVVLVAEDPEACLVLELILTRAGFTVLTTPDGLTAWQITVARKWVSGPSARAGVRRAGEGRRTPRGSTQCGS